VVPSLDVEDGQGPSELEGASDVHEEFGATDIVPWSIAIVEISTRKDGWAWVRDLTLEGWRREARWTW
jgi:hypothetical protein